MVSSQRAQERIKKLLIEHLEKEDLKDDLIGKMLGGEGIEISVDSRDDIDIDVLADKVLDKLQERGDLGSLSVDPSDSSGEDTDDFFDDPDDVDVDYDAETSFDSGTLNEEDNS